MVRDDAKLAITFTPGALELKESALASSFLVGRVTTPDEQDVAVAAQKELRQILKLCEDARTEAKAPVLEFGREIDAAAKKFKSALVEDDLRIGHLIADFQALEAAKVRAAEAVRQWEIHKLDQERRDYEDRIRRLEAESKRTSDAALAAARLKESQATNENARKLAEEIRLEIERQTALSIAKTHEELDAINDRHCEAVAALPVVTAAKAEGQSVRWDWDIVVNDLWALARSHPLCVKLEPRMSEIRALLDQDLKVAGVYAKKVPKSSVRAGAQPKMIDV